MRNPTSQKLNIRKRWLLRADEAKALTQKIKPEETDLKTALIKIKEEAKKGYDYMLFGRHGCDLDYGKYWPPLSQTAREGLKALGYKIGFLFKNDVFW
jgi:hypothetical protein